MRYHAFISNLKPCARTGLLALALALPACSDSPDPLAPNVPEAPAPVPLPDADILASALEDAEQRLLPDAPAAAPLRQSLVELRSQVLDPKPGRLDAALAAADDALASFAENAEAEAADVDAIRLALDAVERAQ